MSKRINIILPERTLAVLYRVAPRGNRSRFISDAVLHYVESKGRRSLREQLKAGYLANADDNLRIAEEWFPLEEEAWQKSSQGRSANTSKQPSPAGVRSTYAPLTPPSATKSRKPAPR